MESLRIDPEFKNQIPPLTIDEYSELEESLLKEGCRDSLITWNGTIVDGHNRYEICTNHGIPFKVTEKQFDSREDVIIWIIKNQFGRRNIIPAVRAKLALRLKPLIAEKAKRNQGTRTDLGNIPQNSAGSETRDELARIAGVSHNSVDKISKIEQFAEQEVKDKLYAGEISINSAYKTVKYLKPPVPKLADKKTDKQYEDRPFPKKIISGTKRGDQILDEIHEVSRRHEEGIVTEKTLAVLCQNWKCDVQSMIDLLDTILEEPLATKEIVSRTRSAVNALITLKEVFERERS